MTAPSHWLQLTKGRYINLALAISVYPRQDTLCIDFAAHDEGQVYGGVYTGVEAEIIARRLEALAFVATDTIEQDIAAVAAVPDAERPRP